MSDSEGLSYAGAGVDTTAADALISRIAAVARTARRPEVISDVGPFAGLFRLGTYRAPVLVASTDSVGTKVKIAAVLGRYASVGRDIVDHCVNDILTTGAQPLFFLDYIGNFGLTDDQKVELIAGVAEACRAVNCALIGGETADMPGTYAAGDYELVASTDSVGTKVKIAAVLGRYASVGHDIVNHCVNDILTTGAEPLFFLDYIGNFGLTDDQKVEMVGGVAEACRAVNCALIGGETADMPGTYAAGDYDLVGFIVGVVERDELIDGSRIDEGDVLLALPSSGLHTNGYSLVRKAFGVGIGGDPGEERAVLESNFTGLEGTLGDALLEPHRCYLEDVHKAQGAAPLRGIAHITGGGLPGNVPRILPDGLGARLDRSSWEPPPLFRLIQDRGNVSDDEMFRTFNMGVGVVLAIPRSDVGAVRSKLPEAWVIGEVVRGQGVEWAT